MTPVPRSRVGLLNRQTARPAGAAYRRSFLTRVTLHFQYEIKAFEYNKGTANAFTIGSVGIPELNTHKVRDYGILPSKTTHSIVEHASSVDTGLFNGFGGIFEIWT